jgi:hypothetical protein
MKRLPLEICCVISQKHLAMLQSVCKHFISDIVNSIYTTTFIKILLGILGPE